MVIKKQAHFYASHRNQNLTGKCESLHGHQYEVVFHFLMGDRAATGVTVLFEDLEASFKDVVKSLYYAGRNKKFFNNCYLLRAEADTRQDWADLSWKVVSALMTGGGIGIDYTVYRPEGAFLSSTGGTASGPISKMKMTNEEGREVMQGGSRRSAIYASLLWSHGDARKFLHCKDWYAIPVKGAFSIDGKQLTIGDLKDADFNYPAPMDMTNVSLNYDNEFLEEVYGMTIGEIRYRFDHQLELNIVSVPDIFTDNVRQALKTGEPGFSFNFFHKVRETLRNACTEVTSEDDSDVCNLASINMAEVDTLAQFKALVRNVVKFLVCGTLRAELPYAKVHETRQKNRRLGLGLMGMHEWLMQRGYRYEMNNELREWLQVYKDESEAAANEFCDLLDISRPKGYRAIAPTGSIGILAGTTTGIEPLFAVAYKRRYLKGGKDWHFEYVVDDVAKYLINEKGVKPEAIETAADLAADPERRIRFQADVQDYVDMSISSTINLPQWGSEINNESRVQWFAETLLKYAHRLRGFTCYPDGSRGGQPLTVVSYEEAVAGQGVVFLEGESVAVDLCEVTGKGGSCGS